MDNFMILAAVFSLGLGSRLASVILPEHGWFLGWVGGLIAGALMWGLSDGSS